MNKPLDWKKYVIVFFITLFLFVTAISLSNHFNTKKLDQIKSIQDKISVDILSSETQFALLEELSCKEVDNSILSQELNTLAEKIGYSERNSLGNTEEIASLKRYYSLLEIKDYLLMKKVSERCGTKSVFILYFYSTEESCEDCTKQGYVLTSLREKYPGLRVYSFDYGLDLSAIKALISIYKIPNELPGLVMNGKTTSGYKSVEDIEAALPELQTLGQEKEEDKAPALKASTKPAVPKSSAPLLITPPVSPTATSTSTSTSATVTQ